MNLFNVLTDMMLSSLVHKLQNESYMGSCKNYFSQITSQYPSVVLKQKSRSQINNIQVAFPFAFSINNQAPKA
jgi:hypothetical protein